MTLPRSKSRAISIDDVDYRWLVTPVDRAFTLRVLIEQADGQGQRLVLTRGDMFGTSRVPAIVPCYVAAVIRHALELGWQPTIAGRDFPLDATQLGGPRTITRAVPPPGTTAMWSRVDFDPIHATYPWPQYSPNLFADFRLADDCSDKAVGTLLAHLARTHELPPSLGAATILDALATSEDEHDWYLPGGVEIVLDAKLVLTHGCCVAIGEWVQWKELLRTGHQPWNGHDPFSTATLADGVVRLHDRDPMYPPSSSIAREDYERLLAGLEQDLRGFVGRVEDWLDERASASVSAALSERLAVAMGLLC